MFKLKLKQACISVSLAKVCTADTQKKIWTDQVKSEVLFHRLIHVDTKGNVEYMLFWRQT